MCVPDVCVCVPSVCVPGVSVPSEAKGGHQISELELQAVFAKITLCVCVCVCVIFVGFYYA